MGKKGEKFRIKDYPELERPYERLEKYGESALTDSELLAIIIKTGSKNLNSLEIARNIVNSDSKNEGLLFLADMTIEELTKFEGIGKVKAIQIKAAVEIAKRINSTTRNIKAKITRPKAISDYLMPEMRNLNIEEFRAVLLNSRNEVIKVITIAKGGFNHADFDVKILFKEALKAYAVKIILVHNHPTGDPSPSTNDLNVTKRIIDAGKLIGLDVIDHIIIGSGKYYSMLENNKL